MKASKAVNAELNKTLGAALVAINQYFLHARMLKNMGFRELAEKEYDASIRVMKDADRLIERIFFLEGLPNLQDLGKLAIGQSVPEILKCELSLEAAFRARLVEATAFCEKESDFVSRDLLSDLLEKCEEQIDFLETQEELIAKLGLQNYLQSAAGEIA